VSLYQNGVNFVQEYYYSSLNPATAYQLSCVMLQPVRMHRSAPASLVVYQCSWYCAPLRHAVTVLHGTVLQIRAHDPACSVALSVSLSWYHVLVYVRHVHYRCLRTALCSVLATHTTGSNSN